MAELILRSSAVKSIRRIHARVDRDTVNDMDVFQLEQELKMLDSHFSRFTENHDHLIGLAEAAEVAAHEALWEDIEQVYAEACSKLNRLIAACKEKSLPTSNALTRNSPTASLEGCSLDLKLDPLAIPPFDGDMCKWLAFKDAFETLVHRASFPEAFKLGKLRQAVSASAVPLIGGIYSGGYEEVWKALKERYDNKKQLAEIHVSRFLNLKVATEESAKALLAIVDTVHETLRALRVMEIPVQHWDALAVPIVVSKLPAQTKRDWSMKCSTHEIPTLDDLLKFLERRAHSIVPESSSGQSARQQRQAKSHMASTEVGQCAHCQGAHRITRCPAIIALGIDARFEAVKTLRLCYNCLRSGHSSRQCPSGGCRSCGPCVAQSQAITLLATARAYAFGESLIQRVARILCDPGSQVSFITDRLANSLQLYRRKCNVNVEGVGATVNTRANGSAKLTLKSTTNDFSIQLEALVLPSITSEIPEVKVNVSQWSHLKGLDLADIWFGTPGAIDVLIGADVWGQIVQGEVIGARPDEPCAQRTHFGWVVFGPATVATVSNVASLSFNTVVGEDDVRLEELVHRFWKIEEVPTVDESDDDECGKIFDTTHSRTQDGRYVVHLPLRRDAPQLGESFSLAMRQFERLERRLVSDPTLRENYVKFMRDYATLGHMEKVESPYDHTGCYYIPHHAVAAKFRVVFNASAPTTTGLSLNDIQLVGPTIQDSLINILLRFRRYRVAITGDIEKMFRQVLVAPEHRDYQRIIWRESPSDELGIYRLKTVTYGMACSPYNAVRALQQCAHDNHSTVPDAKKATIAREEILHSFYVDDFLTSCDNVSQAVDLALSVDTILSSGGFKLRKWNSNDSKVLLYLSNNPSLSSYTFTASVATVLGLRWDSVSDQLFYHVDLNQASQIPTKRHVLSEVARLFDPVGLIAPVIITGKLFIQRMWSAGLSWDSPLPEELRDEWLKYRSTLEALSQIRIDRWLGMVANNQPTLHGFCDASSQAYAAVIYIQTHDANGVRLSLLTARTKVAPMKGATIPRLELSAALLLAETFHNVRGALRLDASPYLLWSDSAIVLCWLKKHPTTLKPFVSNRVRRIQELTSPDLWYHVRSAQNPADCASRGITPMELLNHPLWWRGPGFIELQSAEQELTLSQDESEVHRSEMRIVSGVASLPTVYPLATQRLDGQVIPLDERFSSIQRLLGTVAIMLRWLGRRRHLRQPVITATERDDALDVLIRIEQQRHFKVEMNQLKTASGLSSSNKLISLNPFIDEHQMLRVGGRLAKADLEHNQRFPIILPKSTPLVQLLIRQVHETTLHGGTQLMLHTLRRRYWILNARQAVKTCIHRCVVCRRHRGQVFQQQMASLPGQRVKPGRPFVSSGVDYCGPFTLRIGAKRSRTLVKTYLAIFVCMATKAVHIEVVDDLSAQAFLDAFTRFISRRGPCCDLYSDNGTAFVGANRLLQEDFSAWQSAYTQHSLASTGTNWHFITPSAPHQGGLWEAAVKSAKHHLVRCVGSQTLWYGQLQTLAARIEACLNSRPITPLYDDPLEKFALTPGDFLIGAPLLAVPEPDIRHIPNNRLKQWQWARQIHQEFWRRWSEEYLTTLQRRNKWQRRSPDIRIGDIVVVKSENLPPTQWRMGRVTEVHPGDDGAIRNVTLQTASGTMKRAVQKLCRLFDQEDFESADSTGQDV